MKGKIIKVISSAKLMTFIIQIDDDKGIAKTNIVPTFRNAINWIDLSAGDRIINLIWKSEDDGIIDGDSPVERE